jgi:hypothetical protein
MACEGICKPQLAQYLTPKVEVVESLLKSIDVARDKIRIDNPTRCSFLPAQDPVSNLVM